MTNIWSKNNSPHGIKSFIRKQIAYLYASLNFLWSIYFRFFTHLAELFRILPSRKKTEAKCWWVIIEHLDLMWFFVKFSFKVYVVKQHSNISIYSNESSCDSVLWMGIFQQVYHIQYKIFFNLLLILGSKWRHGMERYFTFERYFATERAGNHRRIPGEYGWASNWK